MKKLFGIVAVGALLLAVGAVSASAQDDDTTEAAPQTAFSFRNTITGQLLDLSHAKAEGRNTKAVKTFLQSAVNIYNEDPSCLPLGRSLFLTSCSGCHGEVGEGKIGPGLNDNYWSYTKNETDKGLFETIFGGAKGAMGPHYEDLNLNEMLLVMAWVRHLYTGPVADATWLTPAQQKAYKPYDIKTPLPVKAAGACASKPK